MCQPNDFSCYIPTRAQLAPVGPPLLEANIYYAGASEAWQD